jgi:ABC-2 type transport system ATP-binding protein
MASIEILNLTKWYGSTRGIEDISFSIEPGEIFGYLGPNGSGKTTTIRCALGLLRPTSGWVTILGKRVATGKSTCHSQIGYLPGEFRVWRGLRAGHSLDFLARLGEDQSCRQRREELAKRLDIHLNRPVGDLSKGNRQKVGVIYAFQHRPEVLILDEPTSGLDPLMRQVVLDLIRESAAGGTAVLLSSHDLSEVAAVCQRAAILREGRLVEVAPISQIVHQGQQRLKVWFTEGYPIPQLPEELLSSVRIVEQGSSMLCMAYQGNARAILQWLSLSSVDRIATVETSLEEAFMQYYQPSITDSTQGGSGQNGGKP